MDNEERKKKPIFLRSKYIYGGDLHEQIYIPNRKHTYYLRWDKEKEESIIVERIEETNCIYLPIIDELLEKNAVILPTKAEEYESVDELELEIESFIETWLDVSKDHIQKATWYVMLSWIIDKLHTIPYLRALGDYGTGKTRYLDVIGGICYKPMFVGGSVRSAPIFRVIDKWRGTAIFDEFTLSKSDETEDIIQILNNGYQRGKPVLRCDQGNYKVRAFDPFGAKILATRREFYDKALESRCITEIMQMTNRHDVPTDLTSKFFKERSILQNKLLMYRFKNWNTIKPDESVNIDFGNIQPRIKQSFSPFTVLFQYNGGRLKSFIKYTQEYNKKIVEENSTSFDGQIFNAYVELLEQHEKNQDSLDDYHIPQFTSSDIRQFLIDAGWKDDKIRASTIGKRLKSLGFEVNHMKIEGKTKRILKISDDKFKNLSSRYVVTADTEVTSDTEQTKININNKYNNGLDVNGGSRDVAI